MISPIKVIITDDKVNFRDIIKESLVESGIEVIAECGNGLELLKALETKDPDVILLDLKMPEMNGNVTMDHLCALHKEHKVLVMSFYDDPLIMQDFLRRGAGGYICKDDAVRIEELVSAIELIKKGRKYKNFVQDFHQKQLSVIQKEIVILISENKTVKEIAVELNITPNAVSKQLKKIRKIIGVNNQLELNNIIIEKGLKYLGKRKKSES